MHCIFIQDNSIINDRIYITNQDQHHIVFSYRLKIGEKLEFKDTNYCYQGKFIQFGHKALVFSILSKRHLKLPRLKVTLCQGLIKQKAFHFVLQKATELGVSQIIPYIAHRSIIKVQNMKAKLLRWQQIVEEASKQSNQDFVPNVSHCIVDLYDLVKLNGTKLIAYEKENQYTFKDRLLQIKDDSEFILCVGPEGGFTSLEIKKAFFSGFLPCSLADGILRSETAALFMLSNLFFFF